MKIRRIFSFLFCLSVLLTACQPAPIATEAAPTAAAESTVTAPTVAAPTAIPEAKSTGLKIVGPWKASEADAFQAVLDGFKKSAGIDVTYEGADDVMTVLGPRLAAGTPPDLAILPTANGLKDLAAKGSLVSLSDMEDRISANFDAGWIDQYTIDGQIYAIPTRANVTNLLWYNPTVVTTPPSTWSDFTAFCARVVASDRKCTAGMGKDTWTLSVLFEDTYLGTYGVDQYNALMTGKIPWNDPTVVEAVTRITTFYSDDFSAGGRQGALGTGLVDGIARVFGTNADAYFAAAGDWAGGIIKGAVNEDIVEGETMDYVMFPGESAGQGSIIAQADVAVLLVDSPDARKLVDYLMSIEGQSLFAPNGYPVANKNVDPGLYKGLATKTITLLAHSKVAPSTGAAMTNDARLQLIEVVAAAVLDPTSIEKLLDGLQANIGNQ